MFFAPPRDEQPGGLLSWWEYKGRLGRSGLVGMPLHLRFTPRAEDVGNGCRRCTHEVAGRHLENGRDVFKISVAATCRTARLRVFGLYTRHPRHSCAPCRHWLRVSPISSQNSVEYPLPPPEICSRTEAKAYCPDTTMAYVMLCRRVHHPGMHAPLKVHLAIFPVKPHNN